MGGVKVTTTSDFLKGLRSEGVGEGEGEGEGCGSSGHGDREGHGVGLGLVRDHGKWGSDYLERADLIMTEKTHT